MAPRPKHFIREVLRIQSPYSLYHAHITCPFCGEDKTYFRNDMSAFDRMYCFVCVDFVKAPRLSAIPLPDGDREDQFSWTPRRIFVKYQRGPDYTHALCGRGLHSHPRHACDNCTSVTLIISRYCADVGCTVTRAMRVTQVLCGRGLHSHPRHACDHYTCVTLIIHRYCADVGCTVTRAMRMIIVPA